MDGTLDGVVRRLLWEDGKRGNQPGYAKEGGTQEDRKPEAEALRQ